eukprot:TRINITY_DN1909_c0_g2_i2.p1 TRINITY_DN1909_c0_g2~~TRINITY_DN1909_c0_g2_i2.p1  ORF type:complete len:138 (-),score=5.29 TRINITY_DN1909_c0_g2_i2:56-469(-)
MCIRDSTINGNKCVYLEIFLIVDSSRPKYHQAQRPLMVQVDVIFSVFQNLFSQASLISLGSHIPFGIYLQTGLCISDTYFFMINSNRTKKTHLFQTGLDFWGYSVLLYMVALRGLFGAQLWPVWQLYVSQANKINNH